MSGDGMNGESNNDPIYRLRFAIAHALGHIVLRHECPPLEMSDAVEARARLCFRSLLICLAALVLVLVAMNVHELLKAATDTIETALKGLPKR